MSIISQSWLIKIISQSCQHWQFDHESTHARLISAGELSLFHYWRFTFYNDTSGDHWLLKVRGPVDSGAEQSCQQKPKSIGHSKVQKHADVGVAKRVWYLQPHHCLTEQDVVFQREVPHLVVHGLGWDALLNNWVVSAVCLQQNMWPKSTMLRRLLGPTESMFTVWFEVYPAWLSLT